MVLRSMARKITTNAKSISIGGFKGSGLAWMVDILSGVFTGSSHGGKTKDPLIFSSLKIWVIYLLLLIQKFLLEVSL